MTAKPKSILKKYHLDLINDLAFTKMKHTIIPLKRAMSRFQRGKFKNKYLEK